MPEPEQSLRTRLVAVGVDLVAREGVQALSLREIARQAGVSHGAPRRYFPTHLDLLSAIAREGYTALTARVPEVLADTPDQPRAQLVGLARAYVDFALSNPGMFDLMFRHDLLESNRLGLRQTSLPLFDVLVDAVTRCRPDVERPPKLVAATLWANLHGLVQLWRWGSLPLATGLDQIDSLVDATLGAHLGLDPLSR